MNSTDLFVTTDKTIDSSIITDVDFCMIFIYCPLKPHRIILKKHSFIDF